jgi:hypothetical protein
MNKLLLGVMQGAGHSGTLWALTSSILLDIMDETQGADFHSPYPNRPGCQQTGKAFVDDTALWWILRMGLLFMTLTTLMQQTAQRWARLIHATTGGALNLLLVLKCFWYVIQWYYTSTTGIPRMCKIQADDPTIDVSPGDDPLRTQSIKHVEVTKGMRTLGICLAPDGNDFDEFKHRMEEATMMRDRLKTAQLNREHVAIGFRAIWQMKLKYRLGATCFSKKKQGYKLQARYLPTFLSKRMGINRTTATAVRHGPTSLGSMNVIYLETEEAVEHTRKLMISHLRKEDELGRMIQMSIDHLQIQAGTTWAVRPKPTRKEGTTVC